MSRRIDDIAADLTLGRATRPRDLADAEAASEIFRDKAPGSSLVDRFEDIVRRFPDSPAVEDGASSYTYGGLAAHVERTSAAIAATTGDRPGPVAILLAGEARYPAVMLAALKARRGFVALDADHPLERNRLIATHSRAAAVVSTGALTPRIRELFEADTAIINLDALNGPDGPLALSSAGGDHLASVIYTSGSTGTPKGAYYGERNLSASLALYAASLGLTASDKVSMVHSPAIVTAMRDMLTVLTTGAALHILPPRTLNPAGLMREIEARRITVFATTSTLFRRMVRLPRANEAFGSVRLVTLVGEPADWSDYESFRSAFPASASFLVRIGSTECPSYCQWIVEPGRSQADGRLPLGRPAPGRKIALLDPDGDPVPDGEIGEFVVASSHVASGYWNDPELTAAAFGQDPSDPGIRIFRTGDLGRLRPGGLYEFAGRKDLQVNLRGHRIEPSEVEAALRRCAGVADAALTIRANATGAPIALVAYVELDPEVRGLLPRHVQAMLAKDLPGYMVPSKVVVLRQLPRLPSLKIDRRRLADLDRASADRSVEGADDSLIGEISRIFETILERDGATADDNVSSLGGDSLQAVEIVTALEARFRVKIPTEEFATVQSIRDLAAWIVSARSSLTAAEDLEH